MSLYKRHWNIVSHVVISLVAGLALYLGTVGVASAAASGDYDDDVVVYEQAERRNEFWLEVAGQDPIENSDVSSQLARRLSSSLAGIDPVNALEEITPRLLSAPPKVYRGITDQLGFDPFISEGCNECGDLTGYMVTNLQVLKTTGPASLQTENVAPIDNSDLSLTPMPFLVELIIVWQIAGGIGLIWGLSKYADPQMTWRRGDGQYDLPEYICWVGAPAAMALYMQFWNKKHRQAIETRYQEVLQTMGLVPVLENYDRAISAAEYRLKMSGSNPELAAELKKLREDREYFKAQPYEYMDEAEGIQIKRLTTTTQQDAEMIRRDAEDRLRSFQETMDSMGEV